jgi:hypothetical protein
MYTVACLVFRGTARKHRPVSFMADGSKVCMEEKQQDNTDIRQVLVSNLCSVKLSDCVQQW